MEFRFDKNAFVTIEEGEKNCYLMANGLGGYHSQTLIGSVARGDQAFFMSAKRAPNIREHMVTGLLEILSVDGAEYILTSQRMAEGEDLNGFRYLESFCFDGYPVWNYRAGDVTVKKSVVMRHGVNEVAVHYEVSGTGNLGLTVRPLLRMTAKNKALDVQDEKFSVEVTESQNGKAGYKGLVTRGERTLYFVTDGKVLTEEAETFGPIYFSQDERDGREETGFAVTNHAVNVTGTGDFGVTVLYGTKECALPEGGFDALVCEFREYEEALLKKAPLRTELGKQLVLSADAYVVDRESTGGKSILAGFPFFEDWGRDTMIAIPGLTLVTGRYAECKGMLRTFAKYEKNGLLPNLFPEGTENPMYNSVDAPLLFINTVYEYVRFSGDTEFVPEIFPVLKNIVEAYKNGTDFHIGMDTDGLIAAGADLEQLTWMDVRVGDHLPTPRHGKPVEINAYWYSALKVMEEFAQKLSEETLAAEYAALAKRTKKSFLAKFWNEEEACLKDVLSGNAEENQVRCNQVWTLTQPFTLIPQEWEEKILSKIRNELYAGIGLRTLTPKDAAFHPIYIGPMEERDRAYHQGTVWAFPLGAYFRACLSYFKKNASADEAWKKEVFDGIHGLAEWLKEGCLAQVAEIYDGQKPTISRGCFAQAWSVGELLRAVYEAEGLEAE